MQLILLKFLKKNSEISNRSRSWLYSSFEMHQIRQQINLKEFLQENINYLNTNKLEFQIEAMIVSSINYWMKFDVEFLKIYIIIFTLAMK
jgi:hypothetical protein